MKECRTPLLENIKKMSLANKIEVMFFSFQKKNLYLLINEYS